MDFKNAKVLGNGRGVLDRERKQVAQTANCFTGAACKLVSQRATVDEPSNRCCKRLRLGGCKNNCRCSFRKSVVKNYSNFMKSGLPQRLLFYQNGDWKDMPKEIIAMLNGDFLAKKAITEVVFNGQSSLFDFLHMMQTDTVTGLQRPIAWIDESGNCFFPELYCNVDEFHGCLLSCGGRSQVHVNLEPTGSREIKVQLEIAVTGDDFLMSEERDEASVCHSKRLKLDMKNPVEECDEASVCHSKRLKLEVKNPASHDREWRLEDHGSDEPNAEFVEGIGENAPCPTSASENYGFDLKHGKLDKLLVGRRDYCEIQKMFLVGFSPLVNVSDIVGIFHSSPTSTLVQARLQLFKKQIEIMRNYRGNANVHYAWFASSKEAVSRIMFHRFGHTEMPKFKPAFGTGIHLTPASCSDISGNYYFDVDENGIQHMLLCRVIMGNMELIHSGSEQFQPSNENYDSGVDDLQNPKHYIIWNMHMNSHIYPEFVVSFRVPPKAKELLIVRKSKLDMSGVTHPTLCGGRIQHGSAPVNSVGVCQQFSAFANKSKETVQGQSLCVPKIPSSPWMRIPMLLDAISNKIPPQSMNLIDQHYDEFKRKKINRTELINKLRSIAGDDLLRSTIVSLQCKFPVPRCESVSK